MRRPAANFLLFCAFALAGAVAVAQDYAGDGLGGGEGTAALTPGVGDASGEAAVDPYAEIRAQASARLEGLMEQVGGSCLSDSDCTSPLRCIASACAVPPAMTGEAPADTPVVRFRTEQGVALYYLEVAQTGAQRQRGLMHRPSMREDWGMLFVFAAEAPLSFWMQNTYLPLDMVFLDDDFVVVGVVADAVPLTTDSRAVEGSSRYVIELNAGEAARRGITAGTQAELLQADE